MLKSIAIRCHDIEKMTAFYGEAFGASFEKFEIGPMTCHFGKSGDFLFKLVPGRDAPDFEGFPMHQIGVSVPDVEAIVAVAKKHGGRLEGEIQRVESGMHAAVRDPDGNTIELYG